jgi:hypothetical protein
MVCAQTGEQDIAANIPTLIPSFFIAPAVPFLRMSALLSKVPVLVSQGNANQAPDLLM